MSFKSSTQVFRVVSLSKAAAPELCQTHVLGKNRTNALMPDLLQQLVPLLLHVQKLQTTLLQLRLLRNKPRHERGLGDSFTLEAAETYQVLLDAPVSALQSLQLLLQTLGPG